VSSSNPIESIIQDAFEDVALLIGGVASLHQLDDQLVRTLIRRLDHVRSRALARLAQTDNHASQASKPAKPYRLHPAIEGFLRRAVGGDPGLTGPRCADDGANRPNDGAADGASGAASIARPVVNSSLRPREDATFGAPIGGAR
jgi:hypothetical protein